jgi:hypothetical protein
LVGKGRIYVHEKFSSVGLEEGNEILNRNALILQEFKVFGTEFLWVDGRFCVTKN